MSRRPTMVEALAIELRWMDHCDAEWANDHRSKLTREDVWGRIGDYLKDGYRKNARQLIRVVQKYQIPVP